MWGLDRTSLSGSTGDTSVDPDSDGARRSFVSARTAVLLGIAVIAVILLALPLREYLAQRAELNSASQKLAEQQARVDSLQEQVDQWQDDEFVQSQARDRLHYLLPGEIGYKIIDPGTTENKLAERAPRTEGPKGPWYDRLWRSVEAAEKSGS